jgi:hypothetical protein
VKFIIGRGWQPIRNARNTLARSDRRIGPYPQVSVQNSERELKTQLTRLSSVPRLAFDLTLERRTRFIQVDAGIEHALDLGAVNFRLNTPQQIVVRVPIKPACLDALSVD